MDISVPHGFIFLIAGFCFSEKYFVNIDGVKKLVISRIKSLYIPCLLFNSFIALFHNFFVKICFIPDNLYSSKDFFFQLAKCFLFGGGESLSGAMWFLRTMFVATILFSIVLFVFKKSSFMQFVSCFILSLIGYILGFLPFGRYFSFLTVLILFEIGFIFKKNNISLNLSNKHIISCIVLGFIGITFFNAVVSNGISLKSNYIVNPMYFIVCSLLGFFMVCGIANVINKFRISNLFSYIGNHTLPIVMLHYLAMKLVSLFGILLYNDNISLLTSYPFLYTGLGWSMLYTLFGIFIPLALYTLYNKLKLIIINRRNDLI